MDIVLQYAATLLPTLLAVLAECGVVKYAFKVLKEAKETREFKELIRQNRALLTELRLEKQLTRELLTKIDRIKRGEE